MISIVNDAIPISLGFWYTYKKKANIPSPISELIATKLTIVLTTQQRWLYAGDAYDLYLDENNMILEWTFRKKEMAPRMEELFTWENAHNLVRITLATDHVSAPRSEIHLVLPYFGELIEVNQRKFQPKVVAPRFFYFN